MDLMSKVSSRLSEQFAFLIEVDKLKGVLRRVSVINDHRKENSAEHSWHVILLALTLAEYANESIDLIKVVTMLAIHDIVEIDVGDTFHYHKSSDTSAAEDAAATRIFGLLPSDQGESYIALWREFEAAQSPEARFAAAVDRIWPIFQNIAHAGGTWKEFGISLRMAKEKNAHVSRGAREIWDYVSNLMDAAAAQGLFHEATTTAVSLTTTS